MALSFADFHLDPEGFQLTRGGVPVRLEPQVLALLVHLVRHRDRMVTKDEIVATLWQGRVVSDANISTRVHAARQAVGDDGTQQAVIRTVHGRGFRFVAEVIETRPARAIGGGEGADGDTSMGGQSMGRPSIAVLPFRPLALAPELAILGEAIPHEIIQALSRLRWLRVIARGSTFRFRPTDADTNMVGRTLGARYVLSGLIECWHGSVAVTLELTDTTSAEVLWADRLVAPLEGIEELRTRIVAHLVSALETHIPANEVRLALLKGPEGLDAWASYHVGLGHLYRFTAADTAKARTCFERAAAADPHFARAHAGLSFTSFLDAFLRQSLDPAGAARDARRHAERSLELDAQDPFAHFTMGRSFWLTDEPDMAADWLARATALNPNYAQGFYASAFTSMLTGNAEATFDALDASLLLSPLDPLLYGVHGVRAQMLMQQEEHEAAARWADRAATTPGAHYLIGMIALAANGLAGQPDRAARWRRKVRQLKPDAAAADYFAAFPTRDAASRVRIATELRRQGF